MIVNATVKNGVLRIEPDELEKAMSVVSSLPDGTRIGIPITGKDAERNKLLAYYHGVAAKAYREYLATAYDFGKIVITEKDAAIILRNQVAGFSIAGQRAGTGHMVTFNLTPSLSEMSLEELRVFVKQTRIWLTARGVVIDEFSDAGMQDVLDNAPDLGTVQPYTGPLKPATVGAPKPPAPFTPDAPYSHSRVRNSALIKKAMVHPDWAIKFETFWASYPRKVARGVAMESWMRIESQTQETFELIMSSLNYHFAHIWQQNRSDWLHFVPHPATWLNQERYRDEIPQAAPGSAALSNDDADELMRKLNSLGASL